MPDGAGPHRAQIITQWFRRNGAKVMKDFPAHSPDLNPIECAWSTLLTPPEMMPTNEKEIPQAHIDRYALGGPFWPRSFGLRWGEIMIFDLNRTPTAAQMGRRETFCILLTLLGRGEAPFCTYIRPTVLSLMLTKCSSENVEVGPYFGKSKALLDVCEPRVTRADARDHSDVFQVSSYRIRGLRILNSLV